MSEKLTCCIYYLWEQMPCPQSYFRVLAHVPKKESFSDPVIEGRACGWKLVATVPVAAHPSAIPAYCLLSKTVAFSPAVKKHTLSPCGWKVLPHSSLKSSSLFDALIKVFSTKLSLSEEASAHSVGPHHSRSDHPAVSGVCVCVCVCGFPLEGNNLVLFLCISAFSKGPGGYTLKMGWIDMHGLSASSVLIKNLPAMWGTWVRSLGQEDPLEKGMATLSSILAWRIPWTI